MGNKEAAAATPQDDGHRGRTRDPRQAESAADGAAPGGSGPDGDAPAGGRPDGGADPASASAAPPAAGTARSRRFPVFTKDTARPEGGGRAAPGDAPAPARQWPMLLVATGVLVGLLLTLGSFRAGTITVGVTLLGAAVLRWSASAVGMLAVRSRFTDVLTYTVLGLGITLLAMMAQPDPWVTIPFLDDIVHFTVR